MVASPVSLVAKFVNCSKLKRINYPCNEEGDEEGRVEEKQERGGENRVEILRLFKQIMVSSKPEVWPTGTRTDHVWLIFRIWLISQIEMFMLFGF